MPDGRRRQLRLISIVAAAIVGTFALSGLDRHDGLSFNARYFLELLPLAAVGLGWSSDDRVPPHAAPLVVGASVGGGLAGVILFGTPLLGGPATPLWIARQVAIMKLPLVFAAAVATLWSLHSFGRGRPTLFLGAIGTCLGWGLVLHLGSDVDMSQYMRAWNLARTRVLADVVPDGSAVIAYSGNTNPVIPLLMTRDIVILDAAADDCRDAPSLIRRLLAANRTTFVVEDGISLENLHRMQSGLESSRRTESPLRILQMKRGLRSD